MTPERFVCMGPRMTVTRSAAALTMLPGLGAVTAALAGSQAQATAATTTSTTATTAACTKYVVISPQPVEIWLDSEPYPYHETLFKLSLGQVFCALGTNASNTRFKVDYYCPPRNSATRSGRTRGWVTNSPLSVIQLNCGVPACARPEGGYVGWVTSDPSYYAAAPPTAPSNLSATTPGATSIRLQWTDNSADEDGFEVINGVTSRRVGANTAAYTWDVAAGTYMCFKIRAYNASGYSNYHPSAQLDWVCITTPQT